MKTVKVKMDKEITSYVTSKMRLIDKRISGIYFLTFNDVVVYVGKSKHIKSRILGHVSMSEKVFDDFYFISCDESLLNETELAYIYKHDPIFNKRDSLSKGIGIESFCDKNNIEYFGVERKVTHIQVYEEDKKELERLRDSGEFAAIKTIVSKLIKKCGDKIL